MATFSISSFEIFKCHLKLQNVLNILNALDSFNPGNDSRGLQIFDIADPYDVSRVTHFPCDGCGWVETDGTYVYLTNDSGVQVVDIRDPENPVLVGYYNTPGACGLAVDMDLLYVANWDEGVKVLRFTGHEGGWPYPPSTPNGPSEGETNVDYLFSTNTSDPEGDEVSYGWDWDGDYVVDEWTSYYPSGDLVETMHNWSEAGVYQIRVKAKDTEDHISDWSDPLTIMISQAPEPELVIDSITGGFGLSVAIKNIGTANATDVSLEIAIENGLFVIPRKIVENMVDELVPGDALNTSVTLFGIGLGFVTEIPTIVVRANASNANMVEGSVSEKIFGPFILIE